MLTAQHWSLLQVVVDLIVPPDDVPGGWEAGVGTYLALQLQGALQPFLNLYRAGLDALEREAEAIYGASFLSLANGQQQALLQHIEQGNVTTAWPVDPASFFARLVEHVMEGFYSDPGNGGNRNAVAWHMIGFEVTG